MTRLPLSIALTIVAVLPALGEDVPFAAPPPSNLGQSSTYLAMGADHLRLFGKIKSCDLSPAGTGSQQRRQHLDESRFACSVRADQPEELACPNRQINPVDRGEVSEALGERLRFDNWRNDTCQSLLGRSPDPGRATN